MATEASILVSPAGYLAHLPPPWRNVGEKGGAEGMGRSGLRKKLMEKGKRRMRLRDRKTWIPIVWIP